MFFMIKNLVITPQKNLLAKTVTLLTAPKISNLFSEMIAIWIVQLGRTLENQKY